jgi:glutathione-regulated potassium-efflux system ancillary protein KefG
MKKTLILLAHPNLNESVVNKALIQKLTPFASENLIIRDISKCCVNNQFNVEEEQSYLLNSERIIFQFPLYWYSYPAILKKWIDEIFLPGFAYGRKGTDLGTKLINKQFSVIASIGGTKEVYTPGGVVGFSINELLRHLQITIEYVGGIYTYPFFIYGSNFIKETSKLDDIFKDYKEHIFSEYIPKDKQYKKLIELAYECQAKGFY